MANLIDTEFDRVYLHIEEIKRSGAWRDWPIVDLAFEHPSDVLWSRIVKDHSTGVEVMHYKKHNGPVQIMAHRRKV